MRTLGLVFCLLLGSTLASACASYEDLNAGLDAYVDSRWDDTIVSMGNALAANDLPPNLQFVAHLDRARAYAAKQDFDDAYSDLSASLAIRPGDKTALDDRRRYYITENKLDAARKDLDAAILNDPLDDQFYVNRGKIYELLGDAQSELNDFQKSHDLYPGNLGNYYLIAIADFQLGHLDAASDAIAKALPAIDPKTNNFGQGVDLLTGWLWQDMIAIKQGKSEKPALPSSRYDRLWPYPLVRFFNGDLSEEAALDAAKQGNENTQLSRICSAQFYLGEWHSLHGDSAGAKILFQSVADKCPETMVEWYGAKAELKSGA